MNDIKTRMTNKKFDAILKKLKYHKVWLDMMCTVRDNLPSPVPFANVLTQNWIQSNYPDDPLPNMPATHIPNRLKNLDLIGILPGGFLFLTSLGVEFLTYVESVYAFGGPHADNDKSKNN